MQQRPILVGNQAADHTFLRRLQTRDCQRQCRLSWIICAIVNFCSNCCKIGAATLIVAEEMQDAAYKYRSTTIWACRKGREAPLSRTEGTVAELIPLPSGYPALLEELKTRIRAAQLRAALTLNQETIQLYCPSARISPRDLRLRGGEPRLWTVWPRISGRNFPVWRASASEIFATCVPLRRRGLTPKFCSLLQNCPGVITWSFSTGSKTPLRTIRTKSSLRS
jgi:hypothetical protein